MDDSELIRAYAVTGSEAAFTTLVQRHAGLVYSAAIRQLSDPHAAQEVSQAVFCLLAGKARSLGPRTSLTGWLYQTTCFKASEHRRTSQRRYVREQEAARMNSSINASDVESNAAWNQFAPLLDDAMQQLSETDRLAILLRYFQNQPLRDVGVALGLEEDTARKRVSRALDKLRDWFSARGIVSTTVGLAGVISAKAVQTVPPGITDALIKASLVTGTIAAGSVTVSTAPFMASTKAVLATAAIVATALTVPLLSQRRENEDLLRQVQKMSDQMAGLKARNITLAGAQVSADELARLRANQAELLRLRGEIGRLKKDLQARMAESRTSLSGVTPIAPMEEINPTEPNLRRFIDVNAHIPIGQTLLTSGEWKTSEGKHYLLFVTPSINSSAEGSHEITFETVMLESPGDVLGRVFGEINLKSSFKMLLTKDQYTKVKMFFEQRSGIDVLTAPKITTLNERQAQIMPFGDGGQNPPLIVIDLMPKLTSQLDAVDLNVSVQVRPTTTTRENQTATPK